ncbi:unnamed protein product [Ranitomeya imitator]|uniref:non-specific serine/threonine protein kinase n=1 Tax=Ranitomeya imitator TaxID=111125 RepID=A0ABN9MC71_9NEOB|nr:unnamed protein product [Ranitomeya imitator]
MGKTSDLTDVKKAIIDTLKQEGKTQKEISQQIGCSQSAVSRHLNGKSVGRKQCGRKRCTTRRGDRTLRKIVEKDRFQTLGNLRKQWTESGVETSRATVHRRVQEMGYRCRIPQSFYGPLPLDLARIYIAEIILAVEYLHSYGVVHRDLKPKNLMISSTGHIKVTDFGISKLGLMRPTSDNYKVRTKDITREFRDNEVAGTYHYLAPEVILKVGYGRPIDWWATGIILYEFLTGHVPFSGRCKQDIFNSIIRYDITWKIKKSTDNPDAQNFMTQLLRKDPTIRLGTGGTNEIKSHPFLSELDFENLQYMKPLYRPDLSSEEDTRYFHTGIWRPRHMDSDEVYTSYISDWPESLNYVSSSLRLSKLYAINTRTMSNEDHKPSPDCCLETSTNHSEVQKESSPTRYDGNNQCFTTENNKSPSPILSVETTNTSALKLGEDQDPEIVPETEPSRVDTKNASALKLGEDQDPEIVAETEPSRVETTNTFAIKLGEDQDPEIVPETEPSRVEKKNKFAIRPGEEQNAKIVEEREPRRRTSGLSKRDMASCCEFCYRTPSCGHEWYFGEFCPWTPSGGWASWFTKIDLRGAYNLVRIKQGDEWKTAFNTPEGHFEYLVMPFGLSNAPSVFQSFMHDIFRKYLNRFMIVYLDDILVFSDDWESHVKQVEVDASEIGAGAVLSQRSSDDSVMKPCAFFSRKFLPAERNYDVGRRELLAMKWAFEEWRYWLEGAKHRVVVLMDHKNLTYLESAKRLNPRQARWSLFFSRFDFVVSYLPGSKNVKADALSRSFVPDSPDVPEPADSELSASQLEVGTDEIACRDAQSFDQARSHEGDGGKVLEEVDDDETQLPENQEEEQGADVDDKVVDDYVTDPTWQEDMQSEGSSTHGEGGISPQQARRSSVVAMATDRRRASVPHNTNMREVAIPTVRSSRV